MSAVISEPQVPLFDVVISISDAIDLIAQQITNHNKQTAYLAACLAGELGFSAEERREIALAGMLHDIGIVTLKEALAGSQFDDEDAFPHAERGYRLLKMFDPLSSVAQLIRFHHLPWSEGKGTEFEGMPVPFGSHLLHLADRITVLIRNDQPVLQQVDHILERITKYRNTMFAPRAVDAFFTLAKKEWLWLYVVSPNLDQLLRRQMAGEVIELDMAGLIRFAEMCCGIIDFRCSTTATHSYGVASVAESLSRLAGFSVAESQMMKCAGYLHDLGKLAVPAEILEKPAKLNSAEFAIIRSHPFHTYRILERIKGFEHIAAWAAYHHERLDGTGYPFHLCAQNIPLGSRIMAVADVFTAVTENRPYRGGMTENEAIGVLERMANYAALDASIVALAKSNLTQISQARITAQAREREAYMQTTYTNDYAIPALRENCAAIR